MGTGAQEHTRTFRVASVTDHDRAVVGATHPVPPGKSRKSNFEKSASEKSAAEKSHAGPGPRMHPPQRNLRPLCSQILSVPAHGLAPSIAGPLFFRDAGRAIKSSPYAARYGPRCWAAGNMATGPALMEHDEC
jgi:hypothetical protein